MNEQQTMNEQPNVNEQPIVFKREFSIQECVFSWMCVLVGYMVARAFPVNEYPLGMMLASVVAVASGFFVFYKSRKRLGVSAIFSAFACLVLSVVPIFTASDFAVTFSFVLVIISYCYFLLSAYDNCLEQGLSDFILFDFVNALLVYPLRNFGKLFGAMFSGKKKSYKLMLKIFLGILAGIVPTAIVAAQLEYDENFSNIMYSILGFLDDFNIFSHIGSLIVGVLLGMMIFSIYFSSAEKTKGAFSAEDTRTYLKAAQAIPSVTVAFALLPLLVVYIIFFVSQWEYYTSAFRGILPGDLIYSTYAREGFFQLCKVSGINLLLVMAVSLFSSRKSKGNDLFLKIVKILFSVITLVLIATALSKMSLYIESYGLSVKRVLSTWLMLVLALVFLVIILKQFIPKIKTVAVSLIIALVMFLILSFSNYHAMIADYNVNRYLNGKFSQTDVYALTSLGEDAVPAMTRLAKYYQKTYNFPTDPTYNHYSKYEKEYGEYYRLHSSLKGYRRKNDSVFEFSVHNRRAIKALKDYFGE